MPRQTTATISFEIELALIGTVQPYISATYDHPAEGGEVEDCEIEDIGILELDRKQASESHPNGVWKTTSILDGVDMKSPDIQKLLSNILTMKQEECDSALSENADDGYDGGDE